MQDSGITLCEPKYSSNGLDFFTNHKMPNASPKTLYGLGNSGWKFW
jgi:hypothetical protein